MSTHLLDRRRHLARAVGNARVVAQDHLPRRREAVGHQRVPVVHRAGKVLVENQRHTAGLAEASVSKANTSRLQQPRGRGLMSVLGHWISCGVALNTTSGAGETERGPGMAKIYAKQPFETSRSDP